MLPYFEQPALHLGPLSIQVFGLIVALGGWLGFSLVQRRFVRMGLDPALGNRLGSWILAGGILGAHLFSVLFYFPGKLRSDPMILLRLWEDISSVGGILGGVIGALLFFAFRARELSAQMRIAYLDACAFAFPAALAVGRFGCALAHDHPGRVTSFPLAVSMRSEAARRYMSGVYADAGLRFPSDASRLGFHDLGIYEFLFLSLLVVPLFAYWGRRRQPIGFFLIAFAALYMPVRFAFDMLRVSDARYVGLTPAQWVAALVLILLPFAALRRRDDTLAIAGVARS